MEIADPLLALLAIQPEGFVPILRVMDLKRFNYLVSRLNRFELTRREKQFFDLVRGSFREKGELTEEQEVILEGIYREKVRWHKLGFISSKAMQEAQAGHP